MAGVIDMNYQAILLSQNRLSDAHLGNQNLASNIWTAEVKWELLVSDTKAAIYQVWQ